MVVGAAEEAEAVGQDFERALAEHQAVELHPLLEDLEDQVLLGDLMKSSRPSLRRPCAARRCPSAAAAQMLIVSLARGDAGGDPSEFGRFAFEFLIAGQGLVVMVVDGLPWRRLRIALLPRVVAVHRRVVWACGVPCL